MVPISFKFFYTSNIEMQQYFYLKNKKDVEPKLLNRFSEKATTYLAIINKHLPDFHLILDFFF